MLSKEILFAMNDVNEQYIEETRRALGMSDGTNASGKTRKLSRIFLLAALISTLMIGTAYAAGLFTMKERRPAAMDESYTIHYAEAESGEVTWSNLEYVFRFDGLDECRAVRFKPGWLPFAPNPEFNMMDADGYYQRMVSEGAPEVDALSSNYQPYMVEVYYAPQFNTEDGAMLLMDQKPGEITEEKWGEDTVIKFTASRHFDEIVLPERTIPEHTNCYYFVIRFSETEGYIVVTSGTSDMETVEHVARELDIQQTDEIVHTSDYENHAVFIDVGQG